MRLAICILLSLVSSLIAYPLEHSISKRQIGYGSSGAPVVSNYPSAAPSIPTPLPSQFPLPAAAPVGVGAGISPSYLAGYGNGLSLGMASFGTVGAGLGIGGLGVGGPLLNRIPANTLGIGFGTPGSGMGVPTAGLGVAGAGLAGMGGMGGLGAEMGGMGMGGMGMGGMGMGGMGMGGMGVAPGMGGMGMGGMGGMGMGMGMGGMGGFGAEAGLGGAGEVVGVPGGPYVPGDFGLGALEVIGPYSVGGIYGPYGWNGLGGRAAQWGIEFGPWDYPFLRLERFEDMLNFNRNLNCVDGAGFNIMCVNPRRNPTPAYGGGNGGYGY